MYDRGDHDKPRLTLTGQVKGTMLPTPRANKIGGVSSEGWRPTLEQAVKWPTPQAADSQGSHGGGQMSSLRTEIGGKLNPRWVEWLMGYPIGWTSLEALAMDKYLEWWRLHGGCSPMNDPE
jgi:hypothetical protein